MSGPKDFSAKKDSPVNEETQAVINGYVVTAMNEYREILTPVSSMQDQLKWLQLHQNHCAALGDTIHSHIMLKIQADNAA